MRPMCFSFWGPLPAHSSPLCHHLCLHRNRRSRVLSLTPLRHVYNHRAPPLVGGLFIALSYASHWSPGLLCTLSDEQSRNYLFWGCTTVSIRIKASTKESNMLLLFKRAYKPHLKVVARLVNSSGRVVDARAAGSGIVLSHARSPVKWLLMTLRLPESFLSFTWKDNIRWKTLITSQNYTTLSSEYFLLLICVWGAIITFFMHL